MRPGAGARARPRPDRPGGAGRRGPRQAGAGGALAPGVRQRRPSPARSTPTCRGPAAATSWSPRAGRTGRARRRRWSWRRCPRPRPWRCCSATAPTTRPSAPRRRSWRRSWAACPWPWRRRGRSCGRARLGVAGYRQQLAAARPKVLAWRPPDAGYPLAVAQAWQVSLDHAGQDCPAAAELLRLLAFLGPDAVPRDLLGAKPEALPEALRDPFDRDGAIEALGRYSLLRAAARQPDRAPAGPGGDPRRAGRGGERTVRGDGGGAGRRGAAAPDLGQCPSAGDREAAPAGLCGGRGGRAVRGRVGRRGAILTVLGEYLMAGGATPRPSRCSGARSPPASRPSDPSTPTSPPRCTSWATSARRWAAPPRPSRSTGAWSPSASRPSTPSTLLSRRHWAASASFSLHAGRRAEAEPIIARALASYERTIGPDHPDLAHSLFHMAWLYQATGRPAEAEPLYQRAIAVAEQALGHEHPRVARYLDALAGLYRASGRDAEAEPLLQRALAIAERASAPSTPTSPLAQPTWPGSTETTGRHAEAEPLLQRALDHPRADPRPRAPRRRLSLEHLGLLYHDRRPPCRGRAAVPARARHRRAGPRPRASRPRRAPRRPGHGCCRHRPLRRGRAAAPAPARPPRADARPRASRRRRSRSTTWAGSTTVTGRYAEAEPLSSAPSPSASGPSAPSTPMSPTRSTSLGWTLPGHRPLRRGRAAAPARACHPRAGLRPRSIPASPTRSTTWAGSTRSPAATPRPSRCTSAPSPSRADPRPRASRLALLASAPWAGSTRTPAATPRPSRCTGAASRSSRRPCPRPSAPAEGASTLAALLDQLGRGEEAAALRSRADTIRQRREARQPAVTPLDIAMLGIASDQEERYVGRRRGRVMKPTAAAPPQRPAGRYAASRSLVGGTLPGTFAPASMPRMLRSSSSSGQWIPSGMISWRAR